MIRISAREACGPSPSLQRRDLHDQMTVYDCASWQQLCSFAPGTTDAEGFEWSPDGARLAMWDSCLSYKVWEGMKVFLLSKPACVIQAQS